MSANEIIEQKIRLYGIAVDSRSWALFDEIFSADVVAEYGATKFDGLEAFKRGAEYAWGNFDRSQHAMSATAVKLRGAQANTLTYGNWHIVRNGLDGGNFWQGVGWYDDQFALIEGQWRITQRKCRVLWGEGNPHVMQVEGHYTDEIATSSLYEERSKNRVMFFQN